MKFGLVGKNGSGKSTVCEILADRGFLVYSLSDCVRMEARKRGLAEDRDQLTDLANELKQNFGTRHFAEVVYEEALRQSSGSGDIVFDSIRHVDECRYLMENGVRLIGVSSSLETRFKRVQERQKETDMVDFETFKVQDEREAAGDSFGQAIDQCLSLCEFMIHNDSELDDLKRSIDEVLRYVT